MGNRKNKKQQKAKMKKQRAEARHPDTLRAHKKTPRMDPYIGVRHILCRAFSNHLDPFSRSAFSMLPPSAQMRITIDDLLEFDPEWFKRNADALAVCQDEWHTNNGARCVFLDDANTIDYLFSQGAGVSLLDLGHSLPTGHTFAVLFPKGMKIQNTSIHSFLISKWTWAQLECIFEEWLHRYVTDTEPIMDGLAASMGFDGIDDSDSFVLLTQTHGTPFDIDYLICWQSGPALHPEDEHEQEDEEGEEDNKLGAEYQIASGLLKAYIEKTVGFQPGFPSMTGESVNYTVSRISGKGSRKSPHFRRAHIRRVRNKDGTFRNIFVKGSYINATHPITPFTATKKRGGTTT